MIATGIAEDAVLRSWKSARALCRCLHNRGLALTVYAICTVGSTLLLASCAVPLPAPPESESHPAYIERRGEQLQPGMMRSDVLMILGNPDVATRALSYIGYRWVVTSRSTWLLGIPGLTAGAPSIPGKPLERMLMFAFDSDGRILRVRTFEAEYESFLLADIKNWIKATPDANR